MHIKLYCKRRIRGRVTDYFIMDTPRIRFFGCRLILVRVRFLQTFSTGWTTLIQQQRDKTMVIHHGGQMKPKTSLSTYRSE